MKRILIVCLLGMGLLLPATKTTAKENTINKQLKRAIEVWSETGICIAASDVNTGTLCTMKIINSSKVKVLEESISGYYDEVDVSGLSSGYYTVQIITSLTTYSQNMYLN